MNKKIKKVTLDKYLRVKRLIRLGVVPKEAMRRVSLSDDSYHKLLRLEKEVGESNLASRILQPVDA